MERPFIGGAIAEEDDRYPLLGSVLTGPAGAHGDGNPSAHDGVGTEHADPEIGQMHRASQSLAAPGGLGEHLRHDRLNIGVFGHAVAVTPMGTRDVVVRVQLGTHSRRHGLLAVVLVHGAGHDPCGEQFQQLLFELADANHLPVQVQHHILFHIISFSISGHFLQHSSLAFGG